MIANVVTKVDTGKEVEFLVEEAVLVSRYKTIPVVRVVRLRHNHVRTGLRSYIHLLDSSVIKGAVLAAEER